MRGKLPKEEDRGKVISQIRVKPILNLGMIFCRQPWPVCLRPCPTGSRPPLPSPPSRMSSSKKSSLTSSSYIESYSNSRILANYAVDEIYIGQTPSWLFEEGDKGRIAREVFDQFSRNLAKAEKKMRKRNEGVKVPYTVLYPSKIPAGISV